MKRWQFRVASPVASERHASSSALLEPQSAYLSRILARRYRFSKNRTSFPPIIHLKSQSLSRGFSFLARNLTSSKNCFLKKMLYTIIINKDYNFRNYYFFLHAILTHKLFQCEKSWKVMISLRHFKKELIFAGNIIFVFSNSGIQRDI